MKKYLFILIQTIALSQASAQYKISNFQKVWVCNIQDLQDNREYGIAEDGYLNICPNSTTWQVFSNQLYLMFVPKMKGDTLLLIYTENDVGAGFSSFRAWPVVNKPFAKLYHLDDGKLGVIYLNKNFVASMKKRVNGPPEEKKLIFPSVLFLHKIHKAKCEEENTP